MTNLTPANDTWAGDPTVPDEGENVTAVTGGAGNGPVRPGFQRLLDKLWSIVNGKVTVRALSVGPGAGSAATTPDGRIFATDLIGAPNLLGDQALLQNYVEVANSLTPIGSATLGGGGLAFTGVTSGVEGGNPPGTQALRNEIRPLTAAKAWCRLTTDGLAGLTISDRASVLGASLGGAGTQLIRVTWAQNFADTNYCVVVSGTAPAAVVGSKSKRIAPITYNVGYVELEVEVDPRTVALDVSVVAFGRQT